MASLKWTLAVLSLVLHYSWAMQSSSNPGSRDLSRSSSLMSSLSFGSRSGEPAAATEDENIDRVMRVIDTDPCYQYQLQKQRLREEQEEAQTTGTTHSTTRVRSSRSSESITPNKAQALYACATAVNAYIALGDDLKRVCKTAYASDCRLIDGDLKCSVMLTKNLLGCFPQSTSLSLFKCAKEALAQREQHRRNLREVDEYNRSLNSLMGRARQTDYAFSRNDARPWAQNRRQRAGPNVQQTAQPGGIQPAAGRGSGEIQPASGRGSGEIHPASGRGSGEIQPASGRGSGEILVASRRRSPARPNLPEQTHIGRYVGERSGTSSNPPPPPPVPHRYQ